MLLRQISALKRQREIRQDLVNSRTTVYVLGKLALSPFCLFAELV